MMRNLPFLAALLLLQVPLWAQAQKRNMTQYLEETVSAERCAPADKRAGMIKAVQSQFADRALAVVDGPALPAAQAVAEVVTAGCMRSLAPARAAGLALAAYGAVMRGAHPGVVRAIASYGLDKDVSEERIRTWADGYAQMTAGRVPPEAASEAVRNALDNGWSDKTFNEVKWGLVHAAKSGFDLKSFASFVFARMLKDKTRPGEAVAEAQAAFAKAKAEGKAPAVPAYQGLFIPFVQEAPKAEAAATTPGSADPKPIEVMSKGELIKQIVDDTRLKKADSKKALDALIDSTTNSLDRGGRGSPQKKKPVVSPIQLPTPSTATSGETADR